MKQIIFLTIFTFFTVNTFSQIKSEDFKFDLKFGIIKGGELIFQAKDTIINNRTDVHIKLHGYTTGFAHILYGVNDVFESYLSHNDLLPYKSTKYLQEKKFVYKNEVNFYHHKDSAFSQRSGWHEVQTGICDVASLMYNVRFSGKLDNLVKGQVISLPFWDTDEWYYLKMQYIGNETIKTKLGKNSCMRLEPMGIAGKHFNKKNPMNIWITNDKEKLPVLMELNFTIGSVKCELSEV